VKFIHLFLILVLQSWLIERLITYDKNTDLIQVYETFFEIQVKWSRYLYTPQYRVYHLSVIDLLSTVSEYEERNIIYCHLQG
jgi:hypothetical protein